MSLVKTNIFFTCFLASNEKSEINPGAVCSVPFNDIISEKLGVPSSSFTKQWVQLQDIKGHFIWGTKHTCVRFRTIHKRIKIYTVLKICELPVTNSLYLYGSSPGVHKNIIRSCEL